MIVTEPSWLTFQADQRLALFDENIGDILAGFDVLQITLTEPKGDSDKEFMRWDQSCDNCGTFLPGRLICRAIERKQGSMLAIIMVGACSACWRLP